MAIAGALEIQMFANIARITEDMAKIKGTVNSAMSGVESAVASAKSALGALGISLSAGMFVSFIKGGIDAQASLKELNLQTGITVETLSALRPVAKEAGTTLDNVAGMVNKLEKSMTSFAQDGGGKAANAFKQLGFTQAQVQAGLQDMDKFLPEFAKRLIETGVGGEQAGLAMQLMAKGGAAALPFLERLVETGVLHAKVTTQQAEAAHDFEVQLVKLKAGSDALAISFANDLLPWLTRITTAMIEAKKEGGLLGVVLAANRAFWTGDDQTKNDKALVDQTSKMLSLEADLARLRKQGYSDDSMAIITTKNKIKANQEEINTTMSYRKVLKDVTDAEDARKAKPPNKPLGDLPDTKAIDAAAKELARMRAEDRAGYIKGLDAEMTETDDFYKTTGQLADENNKYLEKLRQEDLKGLLAGIQVRIDADELETQQIADMQIAKANKVAEAQKELNKEVDRGLTDALMRGFDKGKSFAYNFRDALINMFKTMVLKPVISFILNPVSGAITSTLAGTGISGTANAAGGGLNMLSGASSIASFASSAGLWGSAAAAGVPVTSTIGAVASGAGYAGAGATGLMGTAGSALGAIPVYGWIAMAALAAYTIFSKDDQRQRDLIATGIQGQIGKGGLQGSVISTWGTGTNDAWGGTTSGAIPSAALASINNSIHNIFTNMSDAATKMGLSVAGLDSVMVDFGASWTNGDQTQADLARAFNATSDAIAEKLIPNIRELQYQGETLTQTFSRLSAAQAALDAQKRTMEIALMEAQGNAVGALAAKRADELAAMDATLRPLQTMINLTEDWTATLATAKAGALSAVDAEIQASQTASQTAKQAADSYRQLNATLADAVTQLRGGVLSTLTSSQQYNAAGANAASIFGKISGDPSVAAKLPQAITDWLTASRTMNASGSAYTADYNKAQGMLAQAQAASAAMVDWNKYQADVLDVHTTILTAIKNELSKPNPDTAILSEYTAQDVEVQQLIKAASESTSKSVDYLKLTGIKALFDLTSLISFVSDSSGIPPELRDLIKSGTKDFSVNLKAMLEDPSLSDAAKLILIAGEGTYTASVHAILNADAPTVTKMLALQDLVDVNATIKTVVTSTGLSDYDKLIALQNLSTYTTTVTNLIVADLSPYQQLMDLQSMKDTTTTVTQYIDIVSRYATIGAPEAAAVAQAVTVAITTPTPAAVAAVVAAVAATPTDAERAQAIFGGLSGSAGSYMQAGASGGLFSGWTKVGEIGTEMVDFQTPGRVYTADQTRGMFAPQASDWRSGTQGITSEDLRALRADVQRLTAIVAAGDHANVQATERVSQSQENAAWRAEVRPVVK